MSEGTIIKWLKREGEQVRADELLLEKSADNVDAEVLSPASGMLVQILVQEGEMVEVRTKLGLVGGSAGAPEPIGNHWPEPAPPAPFPLRFPSTPAALPRSTRPEWWRRPHAGSCGGSASGMITTKARAPPREKLAPH
jgi:pyruvate dehydrogenase E2 component (dihydrolipoamide acetyltransferase)